MDRSGEEVRQALLNRYHASVSANAVRQTEDHALEIGLEVSAGAAFHKLCSRLSARPAKARLALHLRVAGGAGAPEPTGDLVWPERGDLGMSMLTDSWTLGQIPGLLTKLRPGQVQSIRWMMDVEKETYEVEGEESQHDRLDPYEVTFRLHTSYKVRGGLLGDAIGFGKTLCCLALVYVMKCAREDKMKGKRLRGKTNVIAGATIAIQPESVDSLQELAGDSCVVPSTATLVVVPPHLLSEWMKEIKKHFMVGSLQTLCIERLSDLESTTVEALTSVDIVLVSSRLWESPHYQQLIGMRKHGPRDIRYLDAVRTLCEGRYWTTRPRERELGRKAIERFLWNRIISDEAHELYALEDRLWALPVNNLRSRIRWGLTGTPPSVAEDVHGAAGLLGAHLGLNAGTKLVGCALYIYIYIYR
jgi:SNF2 family DNA or RNA helicase